MQAGWKWRGKVGLLIEIAVTVIKKGNIEKETSSESVV